MKITLNGMIFTVLLLSKEDFPEPDAMGVYDMDNNTITILNTGSLENKQRLLAHELCHFLIRHIYHVVDPEKEEAMVALMEEGLWSLLAHNTGFFSEFNGRVGNE